MPSGKPPIGVPSEKKKRSSPAALLNAGIITSASRACQVVKEKVGNGQDMPREVAESASAFAASVAAWPVTA